jgi:hypothetical protein
METRLLSLPIVELNNSPPPGQSKGYAQRFLDLSGCHHSLTSFTNIVSYLSRYITTIAQNIYLSSPYLDFYQPQVASLQILSFKEGLNPKQTLMGGLPLANHENISSF